MEKTTALSRLLASVILVLLVVGVGGYFVPRFSDVLAGKKIDWKISVLDPAPVSLSPFEEQNAIQQLYVDMVKENIRSALGRIIGRDDIQVTVRAQVSLIEKIGRQLPTSLIHHSLGQEIQSQSVVVLINGQMRSKSNALYRPLSKAQIAKYTEIVKAIIGFDAKRGDQVLVQDQMFVQDAEYSLSLRIGNLLVLFVFFGLFVWLSVSFIVPVLRGMLQGEHACTSEQPLLEKVRILCQKDPKQAACVLKRWIHRIEKVKPRNYSCSERACVVVLAVGSPIAALLFKSLKRSEIYRLMKGIQRLGIIAPPDIRQTLHLFLREFYMPSRLVGSDAEVKELSQAITDGDSLYAEVKASGYYATLWEKMNAMDVGVLCDFLKTLSPERIALILFHLTDQVSGKVLTLLPEMIQKHVLVHLSHICRIRPKMKASLIGQLAHDLDLFMHHWPTGSDKVMSILKTLTEKEREKLNRACPQKQIQTWTDIIQLTPQRKAILLKYVDREVLALALMISTSEEKQQFAQLLSPAQWYSVCENMEAGGNSEQARQIMIKTAQELFG